MQVAQHDTSTWLEVRLTTLAVIKRLGMTVERAATVNEWRRWGEHRSGDRKRQ
jgi:hypothetical protein